MDFELLLIILVDGLVYGSYLFMVAVGLTVICGVQKLLNVTHGALYAFGAYLTATLLILYFQVDWPQFGAFAVMLFAALFLGVVFGVIIERGLLRHLYHEDEHIIVLATFAAFLVLEDVLLLIWGTDPYLAPEPLGLLGSTEIAGLPFDNYSLSMVLLSAVVAAVLWYGLNRTQFGKLLLAVIYDRELAQAMGINVNRIFLLTFMLGSFLGRPGRRLPGAGDLGPARHRSGGDRAGVRRGGDRRHGQHSRRPHRLGDRGRGACVRGAPGAGP